VGDRPATIGVRAKVVRHERCVVLPLAEATISRNLFAGMLRTVSAGRMNRVEDGKRDVFDSK
jgi:hypothetical protein